MVLEESIKDYLGNKDWIKGWTCVKDIVDPGLLPPREKSVAWVAGDKVFLDRLRPVLEDWRVVVAAHAQQGNLSSIGMGPLHWRKIIHSDVGGVTTMVVSAGLPADMKFESGRPYVK
eukprot:scaffold22560_cov57-Attheya_sp.AAC.1